MIYLNKKNSSKINEGKNGPEKQLISKLKNLSKVYWINKIYESIYSKISNI